MGDLAVDAHIGGDGSGEIVVGELLSGTEQPDRGGGARHLVVDLCEPFRDAGLDGVEHVRRRVLGLPCPCGANPDPGKALIEGGFGGMAFDQAQQEVQIADEVG